MNKREAIRKAMLELANRDDGAKIVDCKVHDMHTVGCEVTRMVDKGQLFKVRLSHKNVRYFATAALAERYAEKHVVQAPSTRITGAGWRARWSVDEPGIITPQTKVTICPPYRQTRPWTNTHTP